jgi:hypothetical protein
LDATIADLSPHELENLITDVIDRRMNVWLTQLLDAIGERQEEDDAEMLPAFEASLRKAIQQADEGDVVSLDEFLTQLDSE